MKINLSNGATIDLTNQLHLQKFDGMFGPVYWDTVGCGFLPPKKKDELEKERFIVIDDRISKKHVLVTHIMGKKVITKIPKKIHDELLESVR